MSSDRRESLRSSNVTRFCPERRVRLLEKFARRHIPAARTSRGRNRFYEGTQRRDDAERRGFFPLVRIEQRTFSVKSRKEKTIGAASARVVRSFAARRQRVLKEKKERKKRKKTVPYTKTKTNGAIVEVLVLRALGSPARWNPNENCPTVFINVFETGKITYIK